MSPAFSVPPDAAARIKMLVNGSKPSQEAQHEEPQDRAESRNATCATSSDAKSGATEPSCDSR